MKYRDKLLCVLVYLFFHVAVNAQTPEDAIRYSRLFAGGTARGLATAGAFGSLGADFSALSINPGGIGVYRSSEIMFTPEITNINAEAAYLGMKERTRRYNFNFQNIGVVFSDLRFDRDGKPKNEGFVALNYGFGFNRLADFNSRTYYNGLNLKHSILNRYVEQLNGIHTSQIGYDLGFAPVLAYQAFLLNPLPDSAHYSAVIPDGKIFQEGNITRRGALDELLFGMGTNFENKLYFGGTFGMPILRFSQDVDYSERDVLDTIPGFNHFELYDQYSTQGVGVNVKFGMIYRINDWVRLGGAIHSPTYFFLEDDYSTQITSVFDTITYNVNSPDGDFSYNLTTPWRVVASMSFFFKKYGFLSIDYEWLDYTQAFYDYDAPYQLVASRTNRQIERTYNTASNLRIGAEAVYDVLRFRAGFGLYGSPLTGDFDLDSPGTAIKYSGGFGIREDNYFIDFAYVRTVEHEEIVPYTLQSEDYYTVDNDLSKNEVVVTVGFKF